MGLLNVPIIGDIIGDLAGNKMQEEATRAQNEWNEGAAQRTREWQERMSNTSYQRAIADMKSAGLNPMLAYHQGGASTPSGATGAGSVAPTPRLSRVSAAMQTAAQVELAQATADKERAAADEIRARTPVHDATRREIEARIPTHSAQVDLVKQHIGESAVRIEKLWEETRVQQFTAANIEQQTRNLTETVHLIRSQVNQLNALTAQSSAATAEIKQRVNANLPELERILGNLERLQREMAMPGHQAQEAAADSLVGQIGAYLRALNPLQGFLGIVPSGRSTNIHRNTTIHNTVRMPK